MDLLQIDTSIFYFINKTMQNSLFDRIMPFVTDPDNWEIVLILVWLGLIVKGGKKGREVAILIIIVVGLSDLVSSHFIKPIVGRTRPCNVLPDVHLLVECSRRISYSFPSSHASNIFAAACFLGHKYKKLTPVFFFIAVLIGYSRVYVGAHYPLDVLGGAINGAICAGIILIIRNWAVTFFGKRRRTSKQETDE